MSTVTLWGTTFAKLGDEAQLLAAASLLRSLQPEVDLALLARPRAKAMRLYPDMPQIRLANFRDSRRRIATSDLLVIVGGPFFEHWRQALACTFVIFCARMFRVPVVAYGVTIFELKTRWGRWVYRKLLDRLQLIAVRERTGADSLAAIGVMTPVHVIVDTRAVLTDAGERSPEEYLDALEVESDTPVVAVTTRYIDANAPEWVKRDHGFTSEDVHNAATALSEAVAALADSAQILVVPMHPRAAEDEAMLAILRRRARDPATIRLLPASLSAMDVIMLLRRCEMVISSRLASTVFALGQATPTVALAYEQRQHEVMDRVGEPGLAIDWRSLREGQLTQLCQDVWNSRAEMRLRLRPRAQENGRRALADVQLLAPWLRPAP